MKTKISRIGKKSLSVVIALMMIVSTMLVGMVSVSAASDTFTANSTIYFDIGKTWYDTVTDSTNATIYANYCYSDATGDTNSPVSTEELTQVSGSVYSGTIPNNSSIRCVKVDRRNSEGTTTWNSFYAKASDRSSDSNNFATFEQSDIDWSNGTVNWSDYSGGSGETTATYYYSYYDSSNEINKFVQMTEDTKYENSYIIRVSTSDSSYAPLTNSNKFKISNAQSTVKEDANSILADSSKCVNWSEGFSTNRVSKSDSLTDVTFRVDSEWNDLIIENIGSNTDFYIQYTPSGTSGLEGNIKVWSVTDYLGSTEPTVTLVAPTEVKVGDNITLTATVAPSTATGVKYTFYQGEAVLVSESESNTYTVTPSEIGTYNYKVVATVGSTKVTSDVISVTVNALSITGVTLNSSKSTVKPGDTFILTATTTPGGLSDVKYKFYKSDDSTVSEDDTLLTSLGSTATVTAESTTGSYYYYVVATDANRNSKTSSIVTVNVTNEGAVIENLKIRFKGTTLSTLIPYMSVDGGAAEVMKRSEADDALIGTHLSGTYRFVWFEATISKVKVGESKTLTFTTNNSKESTMDASITLDFTTCDANNVIYIAVDNLMSGTTAVDITNNETAKTSFGSAMNMIKQSSASDPVPTTLLSTMLKVTSASGQATTKRYYLGDLNSDNTIGIKDATEIQKSIVGLSELDAEYQSLGDFNADGVVDIKDATAIQKYIAGI